MKRVLVIGKSGSGKTTFSKRLSELTSLPLVHLDGVYWYGEWQHLSREEFDRALQTELHKEEWILDGNFNRTIPERLKYCDTVFFFDVSTALCLWSVTKRVLQNSGKSRSDMGGNCPERLFDKRKFELYRAILNFNKNNQRRYYEMLSEASKVNVVVFKSRKQADAYLTALGDTNFR